jgi:Tfp pilus assembly protein PilF
MASCFAVLTAAGCASRPVRDTDQSQVRCQLATGYFQNQRTEAAIEELSKAIELDPENPEPHNLLGLIALKHSHDYRAQAETLSCLHGPDEAIVRKEENRKLAEAEGHFRKALALRPNFAEAWNNLSVVSLLRQQWDEAVIAAQNALKEPTYAAIALARANLGWAYYQKRDLQAAWKELHETVSRAPSFCVGRYRLAKVYLERNDIEQAADVLEPLLNDVKRCPIQEAFLLGGLLSERRKNSERAKELFRTCTEMAYRSCVADECRRYNKMIH